MPMMEEKSNQSDVDSIGLKLGKCISWSKNGFIAYAGRNSRDKHNLMLTYLERVDENSWQLAKAQGLTVRPQATDSGNGESPTISLVSWSNLSTDLAVADIYGNFYIYLAGVGVLNGKSSNSTANGNAATGGTPSPDSGFSYELTSYNHLEMIYRDVSSNSHTLANKVVAFKWLNVEKPQIINKPASVVHPPSQDGGLQTAALSQPATSITYTYGVSQYFPQGVSHPIPTKQACVAVRENGEIQLYYQGEHKVEYHKINQKLNLSLSAAKKIEYASIGFKSNEIIIVAYDKISNNIETYSVSVDWGFLVQSAQRQKVDPHFQTAKDQQVPPKVQITCLYQMSPPAIEIDCQGTNDIKNDPDAMDVDEASSSHIGRILHIATVSPNFNSGTELEIFIGHETFSSIDDFLPTGTTFFRYRLIEQTNLIPEAFNELGKLSGTMSPTKFQILEFQDKLFRNGLIQSIETANVDSFILFQYESGKIDILDRNTMEIINSGNKKESPPPTISTLFDTGFEFPNLERESSDGPLLFSVSPNLTSVVYTRSNNPLQQLTFKVFENHRKAISSIDLFIASVGFALRHSYACYTNTCSDDLLALIQVEVLKIRQLLKKAIKDGNHNQINNVINKFIESIICESHKSILFQLDVFGKELVDKLLSNPPLQKLLSLQLILGELKQYHNEENGVVTGRRLNRVVRDIAWIVLNLRSTSFGIMFLLSSIYRQISKKKPAEDTLQDSITRAECITSLIGSVKWLIDLMIYLNQELLHLLNEHNNSDSSSNSVLKIDNSVALPVILSKIPRLFLMYALSSIGKTNEILKKLHKDLNDCNKLYPPMRDAFNRYFTIYNDSPLNISQFESYLRECDSFIMSEIEKSLKGRGKTFTLKLEQKLVCQGILSEEMQNIAKSILIKYSSMVKRDFKVSELYFYDVDWLSVGISKHDDEEAPSDTWDASDYEDQIIFNYPNLRENITPRLHYHGNDYIDGLRKVVIDTGNIFNKSHSKASSSSTSKMVKLRKCTRCRSVSYVNDPLVFTSPTTIGLWTMVFQRTCLCGSAWINCIDT